MPSTDQHPLQATPIPPSLLVRLRLAVVMTEVRLLRAQLRVAVRREQEAERLARLCQQGGAVRAD